MMISGKRLKQKEMFTILSWMILLSPTFIMHYENYFLTYAYVPLEFVAILYLSKGFSLRIRHIKYFIFILAMEAVVLIPTIIYGRLSLSYVCMLIAEIFIVVHIINNIKLGLTRLISDISVALEFLWIIDIFSVIIRIILHIQSNSEFGFVGHKNNHAFLFVLFIGFKIMQNIICSKKPINRKVIIVSIISIAIEFIVDSTSGAVTIFVLVGLCFLLTKDRLKILNLNNIYIFELILNYLLIFAVTKYTFIQNILAFLGRDIGMSGRGNMWRFALDLIEKQPFWGYGYAQPIMVWSMEAGKYVPNHCHNFFINLVLSGGILYFIAFIVFVFVVGKKINENGNDALLKVLTYTIACYLLLGTSEIVVTVMPVLFPLLTIGYYSKNIGRYRIVTQ